MGVHSRFERGSSNRVRTLEISSLQSSNRRAYLHESDRTLRDGSFGETLSQALRARLRSGLSLRDTSRQAPARANPGLSFLASLGLSFLALRTTEITANNFGRLHRLELRLTRGVGGGNLQRAPVQTCELQAAARAWRDYAYSGCRPSPSH
jgi:hypothetical protein